MDFYLYSVVVGTVIYFNLQNKVMRIEIRIYSALFSDCRFGNIVIVFCSPAFR